MSKPTKPDLKKQLLHLVIGGEVESGDEVVFKDLTQVDLVGVFPNYAAAQAVWKQNAQLSVDNAEMRYFVVHLHRLLNPDDNEE